MDASNKSARRMATDLNAPKDDWISLNMQRVIREAFFQHRYASFLHRSFAGAFYLGNPPERENNDWEMVNAPKPGVVEEAAAGQASAWSSSLKWLARACSRLPKHHYQDFINNVHDGSLIHGLDDALGPAVKVTGLGLGSNGTEFALSSGSSPAEGTASRISIEHDVHEDGHGDEVFYDAQMFLYAGENTTVYADDRVTSDKNLAPDPMASPPSRAYDAWDMDDTLCIIGGDNPSADFQSTGSKRKGNAPSYDNASNLCCPESMTDISDGERNARRNLGLSHPYWKETEQESEDEEDEEEERVKEDGEQRFRAADADNSDNDELGFVIGDYIGNLSDAEAGMSTFLGPPRVLPCYGKQGYKDMYGDVDPGELNWETVMEEGSLRNGH